jgi:hypothetical protein
MIKTSLLSLSILCGLCSQVGAQDQIGPKETLSVVGWAYFSSHDLTDKIELSEASSGIQGGDSLIFMDASSVNLHTLRFDPANKNRVLITGRSVNVVGILKWEDSRLVSIRFPDRYSPRTYTIKQEEPHHYALHTTHNDEPQPPIELWMADGAICRIRVWEKDTRPFKLGFVHKFDIAFTPDNQSWRVVSTRYRNGNIKNGVTKESLYTATRESFREEVITDQYIDEHSLRPDGQISHTITDSKSTHYEDVFEYDDLGRMIHRIIKTHSKSSGENIETEINIEFIGDKEFRKVERSVGSSPRYDSKIKIDVMFDKPDADPATMQEWEYKQGQYELTLDGDLYKVIQPVPGGDGKELRIRTKNYGVWSDWRPFMYVY